MPGHRYPNGNRKVIFLGKLPPPYIGPAVATGIILNSDLKNRFQLIHLDTSDHRDINTLGKWDLVNLWLPIKHYARLQWLILRHRPRIVYIPSGQTTVSFLRDSVFILIAKLFGRRVVCHLRGGNFKTWYEGCGRFMKWYVRRIQRLVDAQIVLGENLRRLFDWVMPAEKIFVVPNGSDYFIQPIPRKSGTFRVLYLANFVRTKGVLDVLRAVRDVFQSHAAVEFVFAGNWTDASVKQEFDGFLGKNRDLPVVMKGPVTGDEKYDLLSTVDLFVFPTYYPNEGHPWVIVEAMAAGLPIISTDQGAITESVIDGVNGFIVEPRHPEQIAEKIQYLIEHPEIRQKMGEESRRLYLENLTEGKMVNRLEKVINIAIRGSKHT